MDTVNVMVPFHPTEFGPSGREVAEEAAAAIRVALPDYAVTVRSPQGAVDSEYLQMARTLVITVPWDGVGLSS